MDKEKLLQIRDELDIFVKASELPWAKEYTDDGEHFENLLKWSAKLERGVKKYLKQLSLYVVSKINWEKYTTKVSADKRNWTVDVDFEEDGYDDLFIEITTKPMSEIAIAGMLSLEAVAPVKVPIDNLSDRIRQKIKEHTAELVTNINETTRDRINNAISQSIEKGLTQKEAASIINEIVNDTDRAELIAHTETVQAYSDGRAAYADESGATGKIWHTQSGNPCPDCQECENDGEVGIDETFSVGWDDPSESHPNCYCYVSYIYKND